MYSLSLTVSTAARATRAKPGALARPMAIIMLRSPVPREAAIAMARSMPGIAISTSMKRMITVSNFPP